MVVELTDVEDGEQVAVTQLMASQAWCDYALAYKKEKEAKNTKESLSKAILKPYLAANPGETLYDGESRLEARLTPHSAPRWLDYSGGKAALWEWAVQNDLLKPNLTEVDKHIKEGDNSEAFFSFVHCIKPGGTGEPRLSVSKRDDT